MFEALRELEPLRGGQVVRCPGARRRLVEKGASLHHRPLQEMVMADLSVEEKSGITGMFSFYFLTFQECGILSQLLHQ